MLALELARYRTGTMLTRRSEVRQQQCAENGQIEKKTMVSGLRWQFGFGWGSVSLYVASVVISLASSGIVRWIAIVYYYSQRASLHTRQNQIADLMEITSDKGAERANVLCWFKQIGHHYGHHASRRC